MAQSGQYIAERLSVEPLRYVVRNAGGRAISFHTNKRSAQKAARQHNRMDKLAALLRIAVPRG